MIYKGIMERLHEDELKKTKVHLFQLEKRRPYEKEAYFYSRWQEHMRRMNWSFKSFQLERVCQKRKELGTMKPIGIPFAKGDYLALMKIRCNGQINAMN